MSSDGLGELTARAESGDAAAQYQLAAHFSRAGDRGAAENWLGKAASSGHGDALYTLATRKLYKAEFADEAGAMVFRAVAAGSAPAKRLYAVLQATAIGAPRDDDAARAIVEKLADEGDPGAMGELAALLALEDINDPRIATLLTRAAAAHPVAAAFALARAGAGRDGGERLDAAAELLQKVRYPRTEELRKAAAISPVAGTGGETEQLSASPDVAIRRGAVAPELCEYVIAHAGSRLGPSLVYDPTAARMVRDPLRTSATASLSPIDLDLALVALNRLMAAAAALPEENGEFLSVLHYAPGQEYRPHHDCIPPGEDLERSGQRSKTALLYLNDDYDGGETVFLSNGLSVKGARGDILVFSNLDAAGAPDPAARHAGRPVTAGTKWLASKWFRTKKFKF